MRKIAAICLLLLSTAIAAAQSGPGATEREVVSLEKSALSGDRATIKRLFAMRSDGAVAEEIDIVLGSTIPAHPRLFLKELKRSWRADCPRCLPGLLGNLGDEFVDRYEAQVIELEKRHRALSSVPDKDLAQLKGACLRVLEDELQTMREAAKETGK